MPRPPYEGEKPASTGAASVAEARWLSRPGALPLSHGGTTATSGCGATVRTLYTAMPGDAASAVSGAVCRSASPVGWAIINAAAATPAAIAPPADQRSQRW